MKLSENLQINENKKEKKEPKKSIYEIFSENKTVIYSIIFFAAGLLCGALIYKKCRTEALDEMIKSAVSNEFLNLFINNLGFYFFVFALTVLLGICLIGFPLINIVPFLIGFQAGLEIAYYYLNYSVKGFGYSLLMIAPFICTFLTVIMYTISLSSDLSRKIYNITLNKDIGCEKINYKSYMKKYALYALLIIVVALINSGVTSALSGIISI
ncbi:MAG TPA: stage II sporulation protein M [Candidatus Eubacterium faecavium]|nr:stage II sporulation protein M [Candidatus Eubacterium faecavium]